MVDSRFNKSRYLHNVDICAYLPNTASIIYVYISQYMSQFSSHTHAVHISWWSFLIALLFFLKVHFIWKAELEKVRDRDRSSNCWFTSPNACNNLGWAMLKSGTWSYFFVSCGCSGPPSPTFPGHIYTYPYAYPDLGFINCILYHPGPLTKPQPCNPDTDATTDGLLSFQSQKNLLFGMTKATSAPTVLLTEVIKLTLPAETQLTSNPRLKVAAVTYDRHCHFDALYFVYSGENLPKMKN